MFHLSLLCIEFAGFFGFSGEHICLPCLLWMHERSERISRKHDKCSSFWRLLNKYTLSGNLPGIGESYLMLTTNEVE